jgi:hypothetical protein
MVATLRSLPLTNLFQGDKYEKKMYIVAIHILATIACIVDVSHLIAEEQQVPFNVVAASCSSIWCRKRMSGRV